MKQKPMIVLLCVLALCGALAFVLTPYSVAPQAEQLEIWRVQRMIGNAEFEDLTSQVNLTQLSELLTSCKASRLPFYQQSYSLDTVQYEIYALYKGKPLHFVLGKNSFVYCHERLVLHRCDQRSQLRLDQRLQRRQFPSAGNDHPCGSRHHRQPDAQPHR